MKQLNARLKRDEIYSTLLGKIRSGELAQGIKLPSEINLSASYSVGRITLRAALDRLEKEGLLKRIHGRGTIITGNATSQDRGMIIILYGYTEDICSPCHYMPQELIRFAKECNCTPFMMERKTFELYSIHEIRQFIKTERVIGIVTILNNFTGREPILTTLHALDIPVILTLNSEDDPRITGFPGIGIHEREAVKDAMRFLSAKKIRRVGFLACASTDFRGWKQTELPGLLNAHGMIYKDEWYQKVSFDKTEIFNAVRNLLAGKKRPEIILCYTAYYAIHAYAFAKEFGLKIPEDISVMGICGYFGTRLLVPELATVNFHYDRIAEKAVKMLLNPKIEKKENIFFEIRPDIVTGESIHDEKFLPE